MIRLSAAAIASTSLLCGVCFNRFAQYCQLCIMGEEWNCCCKWRPHTLAVSTFLLSVLQFWTKRKGSQYHWQHCFQCQVTWKSAWKTSNFKTLCIYRCRYQSDIKVGKFHLMLIYFDTIVNIGKCFWHNQSKAFHLSRLQKKQNETPKSLYIVLPMYLNVIRTPFEFSGLWRLNTL